MENGDSSNDDDSFSMEPLYIEPESDKMEYNVIHNNVPLLDSIKEADTDAAAGGFLNDRRFIFQQENR